MKLRKHTNGLSLLKRRTWYADPPADDSADEDAPEPPPKTERKGDLSTASNEDLLAEIKELRRENANRRKNERSLEQWKADEEAKAKQANDATLLEEKRYQELLTKRDKELADLKTQLAQQAATNLRMKVGVEMKVPAPLISRLQGDTEEALREDAQALIESLGLNQQSQPEQPAPTPQQPPARGRTTTTVPGGQPPQDTPEARRKERQSRPSPIFGSGAVTFVNKSE